MMAGTPGTPAGTRDLYDPVLLDPIVPASPRDPANFKGPLRRILYICCDSFAINIHEFLHGILVLGEDGGDTGDKRGIVSLLLKWRRGHPRGQHWGPGQVLGDS